MPSTDGLLLRLFLWPGPLEYRHRLFDMASRHPDVFAGAAPTLRRYTTLRCSVILDGEAFLSASGRDIADALRRHWQEFVARDLSVLMSVVRVEVGTWHNEAKT